MENWTLSGNKDKSKHENYRKELWVKIATGLATDPLAKNKETPVSWANRALEAFDEKFTTPKD